MKRNFNKLDVGISQLETAIELLFQGEDIVSIHTLASASTTIFADLLKSKGVKSWRQRIVDSFPSEEEQVRNTLTNARNFFKHADRDPDKTINFDERTNDETLIVSTLEYGLLLQHMSQKKKKLTTIVSVFQLWYFAKAPDVLLMTESQMGEKAVQKAQELFPNLSKLPRFQQLTAGAEVLIYYRDKRLKSLPSPAIPPAPRR